MAAIIRIGGKTVFERVEESLSSLLGEDYVEAVCAAHAALTGDSRSLEPLARETVDFFPQSWHDHLLRLLPRVGTTLIPPARGTARGATSDAFDRSTDTDRAPLSCAGYYRIGENGQLFLTTKSAHYHAPLGHNFPGYRLLEHGRRLGIPNATHNNIRGHITRLLEERLVRCAAGLPPEPAESPDSGEPAGPAPLNRVLNLQTGSLAAEAAVKLILARFYSVQNGAAQPKYGGRVPVIGVLGDDLGGLTANYHGTTVMTQIMRGMWPELLERLERHDVFRVRAVRPNDLEGLERLFRENETGPLKLAGFFHELVMMNYGARTLSAPFVKRLYALCEQHDVPAIVDEIQTCVWSPEIFMFREYGVTPSVVVLGKGFPGGEMAASRILFTEQLDTLPQFGALVTNGQEELSALAYLITLRWVQANSPVTAAVGEYYESRLADLAEAHSGVVECIQGRRHMQGIYFVDLAPAKSFVQHMQQAGCDISVQAYKEGCPPSALTKLPLTAGYEVVDFLIDRMRQALTRI
ncbi:MAG: aminotransferase class III-fold pyridoxal phosphate-dependent enzyme [Candidatus Hydrogenedentes bacterium]|nr:aminotransferase class III-fold pyridoxal phosphate-dependent enzyme [Candidatus Hydrogenedentota bacterium]